MAAKGQTDPPATGDSPSPKPRRHAPRGPRKAKHTDPIQGEDQIRTCTATTRTGRRCRTKPILGGSVCRMHGGGAPQVKRKAAERLIAMQAPALRRLLELVQQKEYPSTAYQAVRDVLDRTMGRPRESVDMSVTGSVDVAAVIWQRRRARLADAPDE